MLVRRTNICSGVSRLVSSTATAVPSRPNGHRDLSGYTFAFALRSAGQPPSTADRIRLLDATNAYWMQRHLCASRLHDAAGGFVHFADTNTASTGRHPSPFPYVLHRHRHGSSARSERHDHCRLSYAHYPSPSPDDNGHRLPSFFLTWPPRSGLASPSRRSMAESSGLRSAFGLPRPSATLAQDQNHSFPFL